MRKNHVLNLTQGNPLPLLIRFAIPLVLGTIFQQLYAFADTAIVGRCIGPEALTAVGITGSLNFVILGFSMGCAVGFCIPISQSVGAGEAEETSRNFWNGLYLSTTIGLTISLGCSFFVRPLLAMMNTPDELLDMAASYYTVILLGQTATVLYNYLSGVIRAFGDSRRPFLFLVFSSCLNVVLDFVFILIVPLGVAGAALATVLSQMVSVLLCIWWLAKKMGRIHRFDVSGKALTGISLSHMRTICIVGVPLGLEYAVCSIGNVVLQSSINTLGTVAAAAQICGEKIRTIATTPMESMGMAMATYAGQNYGAKRMDRIKSGIKAGLLIQISYCALSWAVLFLTKKPLVYLLLGTLESPEAVASVQYLTVITTLFIIHGSLMILRNTVQGMGFGISALASGVMEVIGRSTAGLLAVHYGSFFIICLSAPMSWSLGLLCCICLCAYYIPRETKKLAIAE